MNPLVTDAARDWPFQRIDYIFVRCGEHAGSTLQIHGCSVVFDEPMGGVWPSDHFGVVAAPISRADGATTRGVACSTHGLFHGCRKSTSRTTRQNDFATDRRRPTGRYPSRRP